MFCSNCGKSDQEKNTYCRQCGEFLLDLGGSYRRKGSPRTPEEQIRLSLVFNLLSAIAGFGVGFFVFISHINMDGTHPSVFMAMSMLFVIGIWQTISFLNNLKLRSLFKRRKQDSTADEIISDQREFKAKETKDLLPEADFSDIVPTSVTENTTRSLKQKVERKNS